MKILSVTFENLNSISGEPVSIDFQNGVLADAGIFAITGPTGAGKTTILDAMTLALFGKAARYDENKRGVPENMMSRGTGHCFSEVHFSAGGEVYSARWDLQRARKKPDGRMQAPKRQLADASGTILETKLKAVDEMVTEITGMDYPRFLRSVLLAQGRFKEFLDAGEKERGDLLERITGTEIYSTLSTLAHEAASEKDGEIKRAKDVVESMNFLTSEEREAIASEAKGLEAQEREVREALTRLGRRLELFEAWKRTVQLKESLAQEGEALEKESQTLTPLKEKIALHDEAMPLQGSLKLWQSLVREVELLEKEENEVLKAQRQAESQVADALAQAIASCKGEVAGKKARMEKGGKKRGELEASIQKIAEWQHENRNDEGLEPALSGLRVQVSEVTRTDDDLTRTIGEIATTQSEKGRVSDELAKAEQGLGAGGEVCQALEKAMGEVVRKQSQHPHLAELTREKETLEAKKRGARELKQISDELAQTEAAFAGFEKELDQAKKARGTLEESINSVTKDLDAAQKALADKTRIHEQALLIESLQEKREKLVDGEACPLCGATHHPFKAGSGLPQSQTEKEKRAAQERVEGLDKSLTHHVGERAKRDAEISGIASRIAMKKEEAGRSKSRIASLLQTLNLSEMPDLDSFEEGLLKEGGAFTQKIQIVEALDKERLDLDKRMIKANGELKAHQQRVEMLEKRMADLETGLKAQVQVKGTLEENFKSQMASVSKALGSWDATLDTPDSKMLGPAMASLENRARLWQENSQKRLKMDGELKDVLRGLETIENQITHLKEEQKFWEEVFAEYEHLKGAPGLSNLEAPERKTLCDRAMDSVAKTKATLEATTKILQSRRRSESEQKTALMSAIETSGFESIEALTFAVLADADKESIQRQLTHYGTRKTSHATRVDENRKTLAELEGKNPPNDEEAKQLTTDKEAQEKARDGLLKQVGELTHKLKADEETRKSQENEIKRIEALEKEARPWLLLKDLIGSSDGTKFSRFAQGLTLGQLVALANGHLKTLNPRYEIRRVPSEDLGLEIMDLYQAGAIRPTRSLSGGESFLVSLALALGLSEMAGQKTRIESLFIDEGFGSLDADTLDVALSALESLRLSNRTIGIISHVELLKSRIGAQIEVSRNPSGAATIMVKG